MAVAILIIVIVALVIALAIVIVQNKRHRRLADTFGPEYERAVREHGDRRSAERDLEERAERHDQLELRPLEPSQRSRFTDQWSQTQATFVDAPETAVEQADRLIRDLMVARGYPDSGFDQRVSDLSVEHSAVLDEYRAAHAIADRSAVGTASTEDLRQAMVHYRALFDSLLDEHRGPASAETVTSQKH